MNSTNNITEGKIWNKKVKNKSDLFIKQFNNQPYKNYGFDWSLIKKLSFIILLFFEKNPNRNGINKKWND